MREPETYRLELEQIRERFGNKRVLSVSDVVRYTGRSRAWVNANLGINKDCPITKLALELARL